MKLKFTHQAAAIVTLVLVHSGAIAGVNITGTGSTPELACWNHDYNANEHARDKTTCYTSCKLEQTTFDGTNYSFTSGAPNHKGSCDKPKYDRDYIGRTEFLTMYPKPGTLQPEKPAEAIVSPGVWLEFTNPTAPSGAQQVFIRNDTDQARNVTYSRTVISAQSQGPHNYTVMVLAKGKYHVGSTCAFDVTYSTLCGSAVVYQLP